MKANLDTPTVQQLSKWTAVGEQPINTVLSPITGEYETISYEELASNQSNDQDQQGMDGSIWTDLLELLLFLLGIILQGIGWLLVGCLFLLASLLHGFGQGIQSGLGRRRRTNQFRARPRTTDHHYPRRRNTEEDIIIQQQIKIRR